jgi:hypothetical protein
MRDELSQDLVLFGREFGAALGAELAMVAPAPGGWAPVRARVIKPVRTTSAGFMGGRRPRWRHQRMALVVAAALTAAALAGGIALASTARSLILRPHPAQGAPTVSQPAQQTDLRAAESTAGFHVLRVTDYPRARLVKVETLAPSVTEQGVSVAVPSGVRLTYALNGRTVIVGEFRSDGSASGATVFSGDRKGALETVDGHQTYVTYSDTGQVTGMMWATAEATVVVGFVAPGQPRQLAVEFVEHLR